MNEFKYQLGEPNIQMYGLKIWIHRRESPDSNWLIASVYCHQDISDVWILADSFIRNDDFEYLKNGLEFFLNNSEAPAYFGTSEQKPVLDMEFYSESANKLLMKVTIIVDEPPIVGFKTYQFQFIVSKDDLQSLLSQLNTILLRYPHIGDKPPIK
jgi:hypothetical protein